MHSRVLYVAAAILCLTACSKGSGNSSSNPYGNGTSGDPTSPYGGNTNDPAPTSANTVNVNPSLDYNPSTLTVTAGTTVSFVFGSVQHTVNFPGAGAPANIPTTANATVTRTFTTPGSYGYFCTIHSYMQGTIVVQ